MFENLKISAKLIIGFLTITLLLGVLAYIGISETNAVKNKIGVTTAAKTIMIAILTDNVNLHHYIEAKDPDEIAQLSEEIKEQDELIEMWFGALTHGTYSAEFKESDAYKTWVEGDYAAKGKSVEYVPEIAKMAEEAKALWENCEEAFGEVITTHQEKLTAKAKFDEEYPKEKEKRHGIRDIVYSINDAQIQKIHGLMTYYSKEALYQYEDQKHIDEWLSVIQDLKTEAANSPAFTSEKRSLLLKSLDEYYPIAKTMADLTLDMKQKEAEESAKLEVFHENAAKINEKKEAINLASMTLVNKATERTTLIIVLFTIGVLVLPILIGFVISRSITKPIKKLIEGTEIISKGNLEHKIEIKGKDECSQLAAAFNQMAAKLKEYYSGLEGKIKQRTQEVEEKNKKLAASEVEVKKALEVAEQTNKLMVGRELKMKEMKKRIEELEKK